MKRLTPEQVEALRTVPLNGSPNRLATARKMLRLSQGTLAKRAGTTQPTVSDAENGAALKLDTAQRISAVLGAAVDDIFPSRAAVSK